MLSNGECIKDLNNSDSDLLNTLKIKHMMDTIIYLEKENSISKKL